MSKPNNNNKLQEMANYVNEQLSMEEAVKDTLDSRKEWKEEKLNSRKDILENRILSSQRTVNDFDSKRNNKDIDNWLRDYKYLHDILHSNGTNDNFTVMHRIDNNLYRTVLTEGKLVDKCNSFISIIFNKNTDEVVSLELKDKSLFENISKKDGGNNMKKYNYLCELMADNETTSVNGYRINNRICHAIIKEGKLVDEQNADIDVLYDDETDEIKSLELIPRGEVIEDKNDDMMEEQIIEEYDVCTQDQIDAFENQEEAIQEKINQLNDDVDGIYRTEIYKIPVMVSTIDGDCEEREFVNGENCRIVSFDIFNGALILNIGLEPIDTIITRDMRCSNDAIVVFASEDPEIEQFEMSIANIINSGLGCWHSYDKSELWLTPLAWRGMSKVFM